MAGLERETGKIDQLIRKGDFKSAIYQAKDLYKRFPDRESEELIVRVYSARIRDFLNKKLIPEAKSMIDMVRTSYPSSAGQMDELRELLSYSRQSPEELIASLDSPNVSPELRVQVESTLRRELTDLTVVSESKILPEDHPLKRSARAILQAMASVTSGPAEGSVALDMISRRRFLSDWKMAICAIASYYRREDELCRKYVESIDPSSAAGKLRGILQSLLSGRPASDLRGKGLLLFQAIHETDEAFRQSLERLDQAFDKKETGKILKEIETALSLCRTTHPDLTERLKQHISIRCFALKVPVHRVIRAMGGSSLHDAYFFRLLARQEELSGKILEACSFWEHFRLGAIHEGWFSLGSPEESTIYRHMLELLSKFSPETLSASRRGFLSAYDGNLSYYNDQPESVRSVLPKRVDPYFLYPERLCERIVAMAPDAEIFQKWFNAVPEASKKAETVATRWSETFPGDSRPLIHLMKLAERRNTIQKALKYLEKAEAIDGLNTEVRLARWRLWSQSAYRHLTQKKSHLARKDLSELEALPQASEGFFSTLLCIFRLLCGLQEKQSEEVLSQLRDQLTRSSDDPVFTQFAFSEVATYCKFSHASTKLPKPETISLRTLFPALERLLQFGSVIELVFMLPDSYLTYFIDTLAKKPQAFESRDLVLAAEFARRSGRKEMMYTIAGKGIERRDSFLAKFLFARAMSFPDWIDEYREEDCVMAAYLTARKLNDTPTIDNARRRLDEMYLSPPVSLENTREIQERVEKIIDYEIAHKKYPVENDYDVNFDDDNELGMLPFDANEDETCMCPDCQYARGEISRATYKKLIKDLPEPDVVPHELQQVMVELTRKIGTNKPTRKQLDALMVSDPKFVLKFMAVLKKYGLFDFGK